MTWGLLLLVSNVKAYWWSPLPLTNLTSSSLFPSGKTHIFCDGWIFWVAQHNLILLMTSPLGSKARVGSLIHTWLRYTFYTFPEIHLWCDTCRPLGGQCGSQDVLFHVPVRRHWWSSKLGSIMPPTRQRFYRLSYSGSATSKWTFSITIIFFFPPTV